MHVSSGRLIVAERSVCPRCFNAITRPLTHRRSADLRPQPAAVSSGRHPQSILAGAQLMHAYFIASTVHRTATRQSIDAMDDLLHAQPADNRIYI